MISNGIGAIEKEVLYFVFEQIFHLLIFRVKLSYFNDSKTFFCIFTYTFSDIIQIEMYTISKQIIL